LVAGSAFAELRISGDLEVGLNLVQGNNLEDAAGDSFDPVVFGSFARGRLRLDGERETAMGTFDAMLRFDACLHEWPNRQSRADFNTWWMPMEMLWIGMGREMGALGGSGRQGFARADDTVGWLHVNRAGAIYHNSAFAQTLARDLRSICAF